MPKSKHMLYIYKACCKVFQCSVQMFFVFCIWEYIQPFIWVELFCKEMQHVFLMIHTSLMHAFDFTMLYDSITTTVSESSTDQSEILFICLWRLSFSYSCMITLTLQIFNLLLSGNLQKTNIACNTALGTQNSVYLGKIRRVL